MVNTPSTFTKIAGIKVSDIHAAMQFKIPNVSITPTDSNEADGSKNSTPLPCFKYSWKDEKNIELIDRRYNEKKTVSDNLEINHDLYLCKNKNDSKWLVRFKFISFQQNMINLPVHKYPFRDLGKAINGGRIVLYTPHFINEISKIEFKPENISKIVDATFTQFVKDLNDNPVPYHLFPSLFKE